MADAMDMFCQDVDGEMFDRSGTPWPEADITIVDLATFAREGYNAQLSIAYISLINTVNNIAERDQFLGRPIINVTDEGHIITKNPLLAPYVVKIKDRKSVGSGKSVSERVDLGGGGIIKKNTIINTTI